MLGGPVAVLSTTGTAGGVSTNYANLGAAFTVINAGAVHTGAIAITICTSISEGVTPATLNSNGAGLASYSSVSIRPAAPGITVTGNPVTGFGVVQLNGADNVTIDGDDPNTPGINRDLTITNTALATVTANSVVRIATSAAVTSADSDTIKNCNLNGNVTAGNASGITSTSGSSAVSFGIFAGGGGGATAVGAPVALPIGTVTGTAAPAGTTINGLVIDNNAINQAARAVSFTGAATTNSTLVTVTGNTIGGAGSQVGNPPYNTPTTTVYNKGVVVAGATAVNISNNTIRNVLSYVGIGEAGIELNSLIGAGPHTISGNTITAVVVNSLTTTNFYARGISLLSATGPYALNGNTITNIQNFSSSSANQPTGIQVVTTAASGTIENNKVTTVTNRSTGTFGSQGVSLGGGNNITFRNNFIADVNQDITGGVAFSTTFGMHGLRISTGTGHKVYHNSINMFGATIGGANSSILSSAFTITTTGATITGIDVRNNIFANTMTGGTTSIAHVATYLPPSGTTANLNLTWNNNAYYTGTTAGVHGVCHVGTTYTAVPAGPATFAGLYTAANFAPGATTPTSNLRAYTSTLSAAGTNDNQSLAFSTAAPFTTPTNLHINTGLASTTLESHGAAIGVVSDIDGDVRPGPAGSVNGGATAPDLGADEFDGVPPAANDMSATAFIDPVNGAVRGAGTVFSPQASFTNSGTASQSSVTVRYRILDAGSFEVYNNTQVIGSIASGATTTVTFAPTSLAIGSFTIKARSELVGDAIPANDEITGAITTEAPLCGNYNVGGGGADFPNLTNALGAIARLNAVGASCSVTFSITADLTGETGANQINPWAETSPGGYSLLIKPSGGVRTITGASTGSGLISLNGADRVTIDGSLAALVASQDMTITNTTSVAAVIWIHSASASNGASNNTVRNLKLAGTSGTTTIAGVVAGSSTFGNPADAPNSNNKIQNNTVTRVQNGVYLFGGAVSPDLNWEVSGNTFGSTVVADKLGFRGMLLGGAQSFLISGNTINGVVSTTSSTSTMTGIQLAANIAGGTIKNNKISDIKQLNTGGWGSNGLFLAASSTSSNVLAINNFIWDVASQGFNGVDQADNGYGIVVAAGGGYKIYNNSVHLNTNQGANAASGITAGINILAAVTTVGAVDLRDNIFASSQTLGTRYGAYVASALNTISTIDYNDYFAQNVGFLGTAKSTLLLWQGATLQDSHSWAVNPQFVSATDLHLSTAGGASSIENAGLFLTEVPDDIDGDLRHPTTPDIGADEVRCHTAVPAENCNDGNVCTVDSCNPAIGCVATPGNGGTTCRASAGACDVAETCTGSSAACPADGFLSGNECRASGGICDVAESCSGAGAACPADGFVTGGTECRGSAGACDPAEACTGSSAACPADLLAGSSTICRGAVGTCDYAENCTGSSPTCPADLIVNPGTECRASGGICDVPESCDGLVGTCPADVFQPSSYECRASTATCDPAENCTGSSASCPADAANQSAPVGSTVTESQSGGTTTITWTESLAGPFNVYRGSFTGGAAFAYNHSCYATGVPGPSVTDPSNPTPGKLWYYLISRKQTPCGESNLGQDGSGADRPNAYFCGSGLQDSDFDGTVDSLDNCPTIPNPLQEDADNDKHGDLCDNCATTANVDQSNADGDALGDACDPDIDNDGYLNGADNCPYAANDQTDTDGDGIGDACDETP